MKRNKNLIELSRDHHHGLLLGWKIKQGLKLNTPIEVMADYVQHFSAHALFPHFAEEENQVLGYLDLKDDFRKRTIAEHLEIREAVRLIADSALCDKDALMSLAHKVEAHIRFEERELFPYIETLLTEEELDEMGKLINELHQPYLETYPNEFWNR
jgi:hypothetical protein